MISTRFLAICSICRQAVSLEYCKTDEAGNAVHEECYIAQLGEKSGRSEINQEIRNVLSTATRPPLRHCINCGGMMEYVTIAFYFDDSVWEVPFPVCQKCTPMVPPTLPS
jgi:hypothetical protein